MIEARIGGGGMAEVYRAMDRRLHTSVALKLLKPAFSSPEFKARMVQEAYAAAALSHPNIVRVLDVGEDRGRVYLSMELLPGPNLAEILRASGGRLPWQRVVELLLPIVDALDVAHERGFVHRDLKPGNIVLSGSGPRERPVLIDFGIVKTRPEQRLPEGPATTEVGRFLGTPAFAAPEQLEDGEVDARADIFGLGGTLYRMLAGRLPFPSRLGSPTEPPPLSQLVPEVPEALSRLVADTLALDPAARPPSMAHVREAMVRAAAPPRARVGLRGGWLLAGAALVGLTWAVGSTDLVWPAGRVQSPPASIASTREETLPTPAPAPLGPALTASFASAAEPSSPGKQSGSAPAHERPDEPSGRPRPRARPRASPPVTAASSSLPSPSPSPAAAPTPAARETPLPTTVRDVGPGLQRCYEQFGATLPMSLTLVVDLAPSGSVLALQLDNPNLQSLRPCVAAALSRLSFPPAPEKRRVRESFTLTPPR